MKIFLLSLFVAAAFAAPAPLDEETGEPVELIVNGVPEGEPLEIGHLLGIKVKEHVDGQIVSATDLLHPLTAAGMEQVGEDDAPDSVEIVEVPEVIETDPEPVELPPPEVPDRPPVNQPAEVPDHVEIPVPGPEVNPDPIELPDPVLPEIEVPVGPVPEPIEIPDPIFPEIEIPGEELPAEELPQPGPQFPVGEIFNNGVVQVKLNAEPSLADTIQNWLSMVLNYFNGSDVASHQIV